VNEPLTALDLKWWSLGLTAANIVVSAAVSFIGARLTHGYTDDRERRKETAAAEQNRRERLRDKAEELVASLYAYAEDQGKQGMYIASLGVYSGTGKTAPEMPVRTGISPKANADMLQRLYFPQWQDLMHAVTKSAMPLQQFWNDELALIGSNAQLWKTSSQPTYGTRQAPLTVTVDTAVNQFADAVRNKIEVLFPEPTPVSAPTPTSQSLLARGWALAATKIGWS
jgi:hypothetical protein